MVQIAFYHLENSTLDTTLPRLLERTLDEGNRALVLAASTDRLEQIDDLLWAYKKNSWLPHGLQKDPLAEEQPILLATSPEATNGAKYLFLIDGIVTDQIEEFERCFEIFDGRDPDAVDAAEKSWLRYKAQQHSLIYWQERQDGGWENKE